MDLNHYILKLLPRLNFIKKKSDKKQNKKEPLLKEMLLTYISMYGQAG